MKKIILCFATLVFGVLYAAGADYFFYRGRDSDVPTAVRWVRVLDHRSRPVVGAKVVITLSGKDSVDGRTDATGMAAFPRLDVSRAEEVRCDVRSDKGTPFTMSIRTEPRSMAWPVVFILRPRVDD